MIERFATVPALAEIAGLVHGFGRRAAGPAGETREETARRVAGALDGCGRLLLMRQVHGCDVATAPWDEAPEADAAVAEGAGLLLGVQTADCLPVLLADTRHERVAAAHAGWRGTVKGVVQRAVRALEARGSRAEELVVALGPGIGSCCYEVGDELRAAFGPPAASVFRTGPRGKPHLDLRAANVRQLVDAGVPAHAIRHVDECTACHPELYHSYRRDGPGSGRMISFVGRC